MKILLSVSIIWWTIVTAAAQPTDLLMLAASDGLLSPVRTKLASVTHEKQGAWELWTGTAGGKTVVLARTEGDPLNAVASTTLAIRRHHPKLVLTFGSSHALDPTLQPGDVVVSSSFAAFDGMMSPPAGMGEGSRALAWEKEPHLLMTADENETPIDLIPADATAEKLALAIDLPNRRVRSGVLGSANQVNREADRIAWLREQWHVQTEDGESAHIAATCLLLGIPVIGIRVIEGQDEATSAIALRFMEAWR